MAQGDKSNLLGVAYASVDKGKISGISLCIVPTPDSAERSGIYPGLNDQDSNLDEIDPDLKEQDSNLDEIDQSKIDSRMSYASYIGSKRWNEIDIESRLEIARLEFGRKKWEGYGSGEAYKDISYEALYKSGLLKSQYDGLKTLISYVADLYLELEIIQDPDWNPHLRFKVIYSKEAYDKILDFFKGKKFYKEFYTLLNDFENYNCEYDGSDLEKLHDDFEIDDDIEDKLISEGNRFIVSVLDNDYDGMSIEEQRRFIVSVFDNDYDGLPIEEQKRFILSVLEDLPGEAKDELLKEKLYKDITEPKRVNEVKHDTRFLTSNPVSLSCIQSFLRYKFAPAEVRWISEEISYFFKCNKFIFGDSCKLSALRMAKDADRAKYSISVNQMKPKQIALLLITNVAWNELSSGNHHIYRGVLSVIGKEYLRIFKVALSSSLELGYIDSDEYRDDLKKLEIAIKEVG